MTPQFPDLFVMRHRVEFSETDMAGIIHYSSYFRYMEITEHAFLRSQGLSVAGTDVIGWPRVDVGCQFRAPLRFEDEVDVHLSIDELKDKSIRYSFTCRKVGTDSEVIVATGHTVTVCVAMDPETGKMKGTSIPHAFLVQLLGPDYTQE
jgi:YbgC/YbaW family acyl-CoA thioester hydrolase